MKSLTVLRHGKASRDEEYAVDFDRPLTKRGRKDVGRVVALVKQATPSIDWIVTSPALRALQSAELVAQEMGLTANLIEDRAVYDGGPDALLSLVEQMPADRQHVLMVGHNPSLEQLVSGLCSGSVNRMTCSLPTAGIAGMELQIMRWEQVRWGSGQLRFFVRPSLLRRL